MGEINRVLSRLIINSEILTDSERKLVASIGPIDEFRQRISERFGYRRAPVQESQTESAAITALPDSADILPAIVGLSVALKGVEVLSEEQLRALAVELRMSSRGSIRSLSESVASRLIGKAVAVSGLGIPDDLVSEIRRRLGLRPIESINPDPGLQADGNSRKTEREERRLLALKTTICAILDIVESYNITGPVYVTQLRSQWSGLNIQRIDSQAALKAGIIPRRSEGANYHPQVTPEEIVLLNMIYRQSDQRPNEGQITELKNLIREEFARRNQDKATKL